MSEIRELIDTELEAVAGGLFDVGVNVQTIVAPQLAVVVGGTGVFAPGGGAIGTNVGGLLTNLGVNHA